MTTGLLIIVHCSPPRLKAYESRVNFDCQGIWGGRFVHVHLGYIRFSQKLVAVLGYEEILPWARQGNKLHSTICIVLLSEFVSQNTWLQHCN